MKYINAMTMPVVASKLLDQPPPPSGHQNVDDDEHMEALHLFLDPDVFSWCPLEYERTIGGVNNVTRLISVCRREDSGASSVVKFALRVYRNNGNTSRVALEHWVLCSLGASRVAQRYATFSFPCPVPSRRGNTFELLQSGAACCLFKFIPGSLARTACPSKIGEAAGITSAALAEVTPLILAALSRRDNNTLSIMCRRDMPQLVMEDLPPPYRNLWAVHHSIGTREEFLRVVREHESIWFEGCSTECKEAWDLLVEALLALDDEILSREIAETTGPHHHHHQQLIHGDLHYDNVLVSHLECPEVSGVLDFEFVSMDWRVMELAICLSKYISEDNPTVFCAPFIRAYVAALVRCTDRKDDVRPLTRFECSELTNCIALRILSNVVFFVGRTVSGEDIAEGLTSRVLSYWRRLCWLKNNGAALVEVLTAAVASSS